MSVYDKEFSIEAQTALSYLEDVEQERENLDPDENYLICERQGQRLLTGDLALARNEAQNSQDEVESQIIHGMCCFEEGMIYLKMARGFAKFAEIDPKNRRQRDEYTAKSGEAFQRAIDYNPRQVYYFNLGVVCNIMNRKQEAVQMFEKAQEGDNRQIATDARKEIGRIGPVAIPSPLPQTSPAVVTSTSSSVYSGIPEPVRFERRQTVDTKTIIWGAVVTIVGIPLMGVAIGFLMVPVGLIMMAKGALTKVDV